MAEKNQVLKEIEELKQNLEFPNLYLANYFFELRNEVDKEILSKQIKLEDDDENKQKLNEIWKE